MLRLGFRSPRYSSCHGRESHLLRLQHGGTSSLLPTSQVCADPGFWILLGAPVWWPMPSLQATLELQGSGSRWWHAGGLSLLPHHMAVPSKGVGWPSAPWLPYCAPCLPFSVLEASRFQLFLFTVSAPRPTLCSLQCGNFISC